MDNWFLIYAYFCAGAMLTWIYYTFYYSDNSEEYLTDMEVLAHSLGVSMLWISIIIFLLVTWFGWLLLPIKIFNKIIKLFKKEN